MAIGHLPYPGRIGFIVNGITFFSMPWEWVKNESMDIGNDIQQAVNVQYAPAITYSTTRYSISIDVPILEMLQNLQIRKLKVQLKQSSETLASSGEEYENIDYTKEIDPSEVGKIISPWRKRDDPIGEENAETDPSKWQSFKNNINDYLEDGRRAAITGYIGIGMHCLGGYLATVSTRLDVGRGIDQWNISIEAINLSTLRQGPPEAPEVPEDPAQVPASGIIPDRVIEPLQVAA